LLVGRTQAYESIWCLTFSKRLLRLATARWP